MSDKRVSDMTDAEVRELAGTGDPLSAALDEIRERANCLLPLRAFGKPRGPSLLAESVAEDVPRLLAAVDARAGTPLRVAHL